MIGKNKTTPRWAGLIVVGYLPKNDRKRFVVGWKELAKFAGFSIPVLVTFHKVRGFPKPIAAMKTKGGGHKSLVWSAEQVTEWIKRNEGKPNGEKS